jgi:hypothetical protein
LKAEPNSGIFKNYRASQLTGISFDLMTIVLWSLVERVFEYTTEFEDEVSVYA